MSAPAVFAGLELLAETSLGVAEARHAVADSELAAALDSLRDTEPGGWARKRLSDARRRLHEAQRTFNEALGVLG